MERLDETLDTLTWLASTPQPEFTCAVSVVNDIGRALHSPDLGRLGQVQSGLAAVRERLESDLGGDTAPITLLRGDKSSAYLAGAMWACSDILSAFTRHLESERERRAQRLGRDSARKAAVELLGRQANVSPGEVRHELHLRGVDVSTDTVSKALADLLQDSIIESDEPRPGASRRQRFYRLVAAPPSDRTIEEARRALADLRARMSGADVKRLLSDWVADPPNVQTPLQEA